ncbi:MAG: ABC transporter ATP-binding protein [Candidatus Competibacteraceae bacterium]|nr:ABC transporter ATP-binding protein [Candidatus Competibacteraceae bacterium]
MTGTADVLLSLAHIDAGYGATQVLEDVSLTLAAGESLSLLGRNGVGKSTLLATIMGQTRVYRGALNWQGQDLQALRTCQRVWRGLAYVPQEREIFPSLSVLENLKVAQRRGAWTLTRVFELFPQLRERRSNLGHQLSGGEQQMLAIGRALLANPQLLLLDEPSEGLAPVIVEQLQQALVTVRDQTGMSMLLVEQNSRLALAFAPRCLVMNRGRVVYDGASAALATDPDKLDSLVGVNR